MVQFDHWMDEYLAAMQVRPLSETPDQMHRNALADLGARGFVTGQRLRDESGKPFPPMGVGVLMAETEPEVAGRIYQTLVRLQASLADMFRQRLHYPAGSVEPHVLAGAVTGSWFVAVHGYGDVAAVDPDPPSTDELAVEGMGTYASGMARLWEGRITRGRPGHPVAAPVGGPAGSRPASLSPGRRSADDPG